MLKRVVSGVFLTSLIFSSAYPAHGQDDPLPRSITSEDANNLRALTILQEHTAPIAEKAFSPQGSAFVTGGLDGKLCVWNVNTRRQAPGTLRFCLTDYTAGITLYTWSPDEQELAVTSADGQQIMVYDAAAVVARDDWSNISSLLELPADEAGLFFIAFLAEGETILTRNLFDMLTLYRRSDGGVLASLEAAEVAISPDQTLIAALTFDDELVILDAKTGEATVTLDQMTENLLFSPGGRWLVTWQDTVTIWDTTAERLRSPAIELPVRPDTIQFTPDGRLLATIEGEDIRLWNIESGENTGTITGHRGGVRLLAFGGESQRAITVNTQGYGRFWRISPAGVPSLIWWYQGEIDDVLVSPDSRSLISIRQDFPLRFWNFENGQVRGQYALPPNVILSPDWTLMAVAYGELVVWHGLRGDPRQFDQMPFAFTERATNVRPTPSQELPRFEALPAQSPIFALGKDATGQWLHIQLVDGRRGWVQLDTLVLNGNIDNLPEVEAAESGES